MQVIKTSAERDPAEVRAALESAGMGVIGECDVECPELAGHHVLVADAGAAVETLADEGISAIRVKPPTPVTDCAILWWKEWKLALSDEGYDDFRLLHHEEVLSVGSIVRVRESDFPADEGSDAEPWSVLADGGVDIRCEFHCDLPTGREVHLLIPDAEKATDLLEAAGFRATPVDYEGAEVGQGIAWWGRWKPALAYAQETQRPILLSFASPRVEQVPGIW